MCQFWHILLHKPTIWLRNKDKNLRWQAFCYMPLYKTIIEKRNHERRKQK